jgi:hypothetical protein
VDCPTRPRAGCTRHVLAERADVVADYEEQPEDATGMVEATSPTTTDVTVML